MKLRQLPTAWIVDYSAARAQAIRRLGDRYLLAHSINARRYVSQPSTPALVTAPPAHGAAVTEPEAASASTAHPALLACS